MTVFNIFEYQIEGNSVLRTIDVERAVTPYLGENKTIKDVEAARAELERVYRDSGYKTVQVNIPPQKVADGVVRLAVTEGRVGKLKVAGSKYHSPQVIRDKLSQLNPDSVPNFNEVQKEMGEVNRSDDLHVTPVLRASDTPGRVDIDLDVKDDLPLHALLDVNNRYNANTTHLRTTGEVRYDNLFQSDQSASFQYQIAPENAQDAKIWSASYVIPDIQSSRIRAVCRAFGQQCRGRRHRGRHRKGRHLWHSRDHAVAPPTAMISTTASRPVLTTRTSNSPWCSRALPAPSSLPSAITRSRWITAVRGWVRLRRKASEVRR